MDIKPLTKFSNLTFLEEIPERTRQGHIKCLCKCDCGKIIKNRKSRLLDGTTKSCGCLKKKYISISITKHGMSRTKIYTAWSSMKERTLNSNHHYYKNYGGRGIKVCKEWLTFDNFYKWAKNKYKEGLQIDRINNEKGYYPENCRFVSRSKNMQNTRKSCVWIVHGKRFLSLKAAAIYFNVNSGKIYEWCVGKYKNRNICLSTPKKNCFREYKYKNVKDAEAL